MSSFAYSMGIFELIITSGQLIYNYNIHGIAKKIWPIFQVVGGQRK